MYRLLLGGKTVWVGGTEDQCPSLQVVRTTNVKPKKGSTPPAGDSPKRTKPTRRRRKVVMDPRGKFILRAVGDKRSGYATKMATKARSVVMWPRHLGDKVTIDGKVHSKAGTSGYMNIGDVVDEGITSELPTEGEAVVLVGATPFTVNLTKKGKLWTLDRPFRAGDSGSPVLMKESVVGFVVFSGSESSVIAHVEETGIATPSMPKDMEVVGQILPAVTDPYTFKAVGHMTGKATKIQDSAGYIWLYWPRHLGKTVLVDGRLYTTITSKGYIFQAPISGPARPMETIYQGTAFVHEKHAFDTIKASREVYAVKMEKGSVYDILEQYDSGSSESGDDTAVTELEQAEAKQAGTLSTAPYTWFVDRPYSPGSSGTPVINSYGAVIGIITHSDRRETVISPAVFHETEQGECELYFAEPRPTPTMRPVGSSNCMAFILLLLLAVTAAVPLCLDPCVNRTHLGFSGQILYDVCVQDYGVDVSEGCQYYPKAGLFRTKRALDPAAVYYPYGAMMNQCVNSGNIVDNSTKCTSDRPLVRVEVDPWLDDTYVVTVGFVPNGDAGAAITHGLCYNGLSPFRVGPGTTFDCAYVVYSIGTNTVRCTTLWETTTAIAVTCGQDCDRKVEFLEMFMGGSYNSIIPVKPRCKPHMVGREAKAASQSGGNTYEYVQFEPGESLDKVLVAFHCQEVPAQHSPGDKPFVKNTVYTLNDQYLVSFTCAAKYGLGSITDVATPGVVVMLDTFQFHGAFFTAGCSLNYIGCVVLFTDHPKASYRNSEAYAHYSGHLLRPNTYGLVRKQHFQSPVEYTYDSDSTQVTVTVARPALVGIGEQSRYCDLVCTFDVHKTSVITVGNNPAKWIQWKDKHIVDKALDDQLPAVIGTISALFFVSVITLVVCSIARYRTSSTAGYTLLRPVSSALIGDYVKTMEWMDSHEVASYIFYISLILFTVFIFVLYLWGRNRHIHYQSLALFSFFGGVRGGNTGSTEDIKQWSLWRWCAEWPHLSLFLWGAALLGYVRALITAITAKSKHLYISPSTILCSILVFSTVGFGTGLVVPVGHTEDAGEFLKAYDLLVTGTVSLNHRAQPQEWTITPQGSSVMPETARVYVKHRQITYDLLLEGYTSGYTIVEDAALKCCSSHAGDLDPQPISAFGRLAPYKINSTYNGFYSRSMGDVYNCLWSAGHCPCCAGENVIQYGAVIIPTKTKDPKSYAVFAKVRPGVETVTVCYGIGTRGDTCVVVSSNGQLQAGDMQLSPPSDILNPLPDRVVIHDGQIYDQAYAPYAGGNPGELGDIQWKAHDYDAVPKDMYAPPGMISVRHPGTYQAKLPVDQAESGFDRWVKEKHTGLNLHGIDGCMVHVTTPGDGLPQLITTGCSSGFAEFAWRIPDYSFERLAEVPTVNIRGCKQTERGAYGSDNASAVVLDIEPVSYRCPVVVEGGTGLNATIAITALVSKYTLFVHTEGPKVDLSVKICNTTTSCSVEADPPKAHEIVTVARHVADIHASPTTPVNLFLIILISIIIVVVVVAIVIAITICCARCMR